MAGPIWSSAHRVSQQWPWHPSLTLKTKILRLGFPALVRARGSLPSLRMTAPERKLFRFLQRLHVLFQGAGVLALGFQVGLELFHQSFQAHDFELEFLHVHAGGR